MIDQFQASFYQNFIEDDRWRYLTDGLITTLKITFFAVLIGIADWISSSCYPIYL